MRVVALVFIAVGVAGAVSRDFVLEWPLVLLLLVSGLPFWTEKASRRPASRGGRRPAEVSSPTEVTTC